MIFTSIKSISIFMYDFFWTSVPFCGIVLYCKGGADMAQISIAEIYSGEKYGVMSAAITDYMTNGRLSEYDERTWVDMLL